MRIALLLSAYPLVQLLLHLTLGEGLAEDEAEQLILAQSLALGYPGTGSQPPLYTWLQMAFFAAFGINVFALAALRAVLQVLTQVALYRSADMLLSNRTLASLVALSLWLIPQFAVESLRKTHSVLAACLAAVFLHALLHVWESGGWGAYVWLGATLGLGVLAKYNFAIFAAALLLAAGSLAPLRGALASPRFAVTVAVAALLAAPHFTWLLHHLSTVTGEVASRVAAGRMRPWTAAGATAGLVDLAEAVAGYLPPVVLHLAAFGIPRRPISARAAVTARLAQRFWLLALVALIAAVVMLAIPRFHEYWLQPYLVMLPLYLFLSRSSAAPAPRRLKVFAVVVGAVMALWVGWRVVEAWVGHHAGARARANAPYGEVGRRIAESGFRERIIVAENVRLGGNLRLVLPGAHVITAGMAAGARVPRGPCLLVWTESPGESVPPAFERWAGPGGQPIPPARYVEARGPRANLLRLGIIAVPSCER